ncbi:MAG: hypothetical protein KDD64_06960 [Bdellovibrionales bacterium]|nr:hypothetical protein [Bdellovibrionales bacterium]
MNKLFVSILLSLFGVASACAQAYSPLSPNSNLNCVYQPNGKTQIAKRDGDTYRLTGFSSATKSAVKRRRAYVRKTGQIKKLISRLKKKRKRGTFEVSVNSKEFKDITKFFFDGEVTGAPPASVDENIQILQGLASTYSADAKYEQELIKLVKNCKKRKIPLEGEFYTKFVNIISNPYNATTDSSGTGYVAVMAVVPYGLASALPLLCYSNSNKSIRYKEATKTPCFTATLSNRDPETCDHLITYSYGYPDYYLAVLDAVKFSYYERAGKISFEDAAKAAEARLRTEAPYMWGDSVKYAVGSVDNCNASRFE